MAVATFDTLKFADTLKAGGVPPAQPEAQARAMAEVIQLNFKGLATKDDVAAVKADLAHLRDESKRDIADLANQFSTKLDLQASQLTTKFDLQFAAVRTELTVLRWMVGLSITLLTGIAIRLFFFKL